MSHAFLLLAAMMQTQSATSDGSVDRVAQDEPETTSARDADRPVEDEDAIIVRGARAAGATLGDIEPELVLGEAEISAYGASTFADLLQLLTPETESSRGRGGRGGGGQPVILLNGFRIASFREIARYPTEALSRVDVLPEETAIRYGFRADQRVVNFVLKPGFRAVQAEIEAGGPSEWDRLQMEYEPGYIQFGDNRRWSFDAEFTTGQELLESDRNVITAPPALPFDLVGNIGAPTFGEEIDPALSALVGEITTVAAVPGTASTGAPELEDFVPGAGLTSETDFGEFRTLLPEEYQYSVGGTHNRRVFNDAVSLSLSAAINGSESDSLLGLASTTLELPTGSPFSPFGQDVSLFRYVDGDGVLTRNREQNGHEASVTLSGTQQGWRWDVIGNYNYNDVTTLTDRRADASAAQTLIDAGDATFNPFGDLTGQFTIETDRAENESRGINLDTTVNGFLFDLPAGPVSTTFRSTVSRRELSTRSLVAGVAQDTDLERDRGTFRASFDVPLAERPADKDWSVIGDLGFDIQGDVEELSDAGTLTTWSTGVRWSPHKKIRVRGSYRREEGAPSISQLGDPQILTPNVRVFDFTTGETVEVTRLSGGNPDLINDTREVRTVGVRFNPIEGTQLSLSSDYTDVIIENPISSFPTLTPEIEAAFPDRFERDDDGVLISIDITPINYQEQTRRDLRSGFTFSKRLGSAGRGRGGRPSGAGSGGRPPSAAQRGGQRPAQQGRPPQTQQAQGTPPQGQPPQGQPPQGRPQQGQPPQGAPQQGRPPAAGAPGQTTPGQQGRPPAAGGQQQSGAPARRGPPRGAFGGGRPGGFTRFSVFHTWNLEQEIVIRDGVPVLDLLNGSAVGAQGGVPEHQIQADLFYVYNGIGGGFSYRWQDGTTVLGDATPDDDLDFQPFDRLNVRAFVDLDRRAKLKERFPWVAGSRVRLSVNNVFDERLDVRGADGTVPLNYQPDLIDPLGRTVEISFRKLFF